MYSGIAPVAELDENGDVAKVFVYGTKVNVPDYMKRLEGGSWVSYRIISDQVGSPRLVVRADTGDVALRIDYDEFGNETFVDAASGLDRSFIPFGFAGGLYDEDTGLVRFGARDYDPQTGRWTAKDPILFAGGDTNLYGYVMADPVNLIDPNGKQVSCGRPFLFVPGWFCFHWAPISKDSPIYVPEPLGYYEIFNSEWWVYFFLSDKKFHEAEERYWDWKTLNDGICSQAGPGA